MKLAAVLSMLAAVALASARGQPAAPAELPIQYWQLSTGSRIAFIHVPAAAAPQAVRRTPIVFVHGGPGACEVYAYAFAHPWYGRLAAQGFDVYLYDQIGGGFSARLSNPRAYTVDRHVADLEALRAAIGAEQLILVGESWGASLSASYAAAHPDRVERLAFLAPGALAPAERKHQIFPFSTPRLTPEFLAWLGRTRGPVALRRAEQLNALLARDVAAAHVFAPDAEMDPLMDAYINEQILVTCVHDPAKLRARGFALHGTGFWASLLTTWDAVNRRTDLRARLEALRLPVLIVRGDSDYLPPAIAADYAAVFPHADYVHVPAAGHFLWLDQPELYRRELEDFLQQPAGPPPPSPSS